MDYGSATNYLYNLQRFGIKLGLDNITELLSGLGNPHDRLKCIHVGGSNGKGSVCAYIASILRTQGYKVGLYTSPHLVEFTERIRIDGADISKNDVVRLTNKIKPIIESMASESKTKQPTFFEVTTAMALMHFALNNVDFAVLEVGLGGRLDATNVVKPIVSVITRIAHEHTEHLGKDLERIAWEKAGIIKDKVPVVTSELKYQKAIRDVAKNKNADLITVGRDLKYARMSSTLEYQSFSVSSKKRRYELKTRLLGGYQIENAATAIAAVDVLKDNGVAISTKAIKNGMLNAEWPGRFQIVKTQPLVILDCAHNPDGARALAKSIRELKSKRVILAIGMLKDKDPQGVAKFLGPLADRVMITMPDTPRACKPEALERAFEDYADEIMIIKEVGSAIDHALTSSKREDTICITGSIYTVGEAMVNLHQLRIAKIEKAMKKLRTKYHSGAFPGKDVEATTIKKEEREPFRVLIATILSHRTKDENTHVAIERLFKRYNTPKKIANANQRAIEKLIRTAGFYKIKAKRLKEVSKILLEEFNGRVPADFDSLMSLPSVGRKTANCVLVYGFNEPAIPVDTHLHRIPNRLGLVETKTPEETEKELISFVPKKYWLDINELFVKFGQDVCKPIGPKCNQCTMNDICDYYKYIIKN